MDMMKFQLLPYIIPCYFRCKILYFGLTIFSYQ